MVSFRMFSAVKPHCGQVAAVRMVFRFAFANVGQPARGGGWARASALTCDVGICAAKTKVHAAVRAISDEFRGLCGTGTFGRGRSENRLSAPPAQGGNSPTIAHRAGTAATGECAAPRTRRRRERAFALLFFAALSAALPAADVAPLPAGVQLRSDIAFLEAGRAEKLDVYLPPGGAVTGARRPAIVYFHGGGWVRGDKATERERNIGGHFAAAGFVFASVNYLIGPGAWPKNLLDCKNAVRFLRVRAGEFGVDPDRIAAMGTSAGGHLALMVAYTRGVDGFEPAAPYPHVSDAVSAVIDFYGMTNLLTRRVVERDGTPTGRFMDSNAPAVLGVGRTEGPEVWRSASPVTHVTPNSPPTLIVHGLADATVDYIQAVELANVLRARSVPHELLLLEGIGHMFNFDTCQDQPMPAHLRPAVLAFAAKYLGAPLAARGP